MGSSSAQQILYGFLSGLTEILPVSARAHSMVLLKLLGSERVAGLMSLLIHVGILAALYLHNRIQLVKMSRARKLYRIPKKKRKRPLDVASLMDSRFLLAMCIPTVVMLVFYDQLSRISFSLLLVSGFLLVNGIVLYVPQFLPGSNRDARTLSGVEGMLMGLGGILSVIPGFSGVGAALSIGSVCGVDRSYSLTMALLMQMVYVAGLIVFDVLAIITRGFGPLSAPLLVTYILAAAAAFVSTMLGIRIMRALAKESGHSIFAYYCWGFALFVFILNLMA